MSNKILAKHSLEILEARIAPAAVTGPLLPSTDDKFVQASFNGPVLVKEGQVLNTTGDANSGTYLLFMEKGNALVFFSDFNNNHAIDINELTGISAGDGSRIIAFTDIHGDIVTNLKEINATVLGSNGLPTTITDFALSDSDNNATNDSIQTGGDGRVLLNKTIEKVELRSLRISDLPDQNGDGVVDDQDVALRTSPSTYSIFGNIFAGKGFGAQDGGLIIDTTNGTNFGFELIPTIGSIKTGTAASGEYFTFGASADDNTNGTLVPFTPPPNQAGGDIIGVKGLDKTVKFNLNTLHAGDGGVGARGGNIENVLISGDDTGGYEIIAGKGGGGINGGAGGSILNFSDFGSQTGKVVIQSGDGGDGRGGTGGDGGGFSFNTFNIRGNVNVQLGNGGDGFLQGGDGASLAKGDFTQPNFSTFNPANGTGTTHLASTIDWQLGAASYIANIGTNQAIDFDKDGFGDFVFTTRETSQLVVLFGDGVGGFRLVLGPDGTFVSDRIYLPGVRDPEALTVADLNGDGILDIATASIDQGSHAGVAVFLGKFEHEGKGALTGAEDLNHNGVNDFTGFSDVRYSTLPQLDEFEFWAGPQQVTSLVAGDFDGDGKPELALIATYYQQKQEQNGVTTSLTRPTQTLFFLQPDVERDNLAQDDPTTPFDEHLKITGQYYLGSLTDYTLIVGADAEDSPGAPKVIIEASALSTTSTNDVVFYGIVGSPNNDRAVHTVGVGGGGSFVFGRVDTDRELAEPGNAHRDATDVSLLKFTIFDYETAGMHDGIADIAVITQAPDLYLIGIKGDGMGGGTQSSGNGIDNAGNYFGTKGYNISDSLVDIKAIDADADGFIDDVAIYHVKGGHDRNATLVFQEGVLPTDPNPATQATGAILKFNALAELDAPGNSYAEPSVFAVYYADASIAGIKTPGIAVADSNEQSDFYFTQVSNGTGAIVSLELLREIGLRVTAGEGGDSIIGNGGLGGSLGGGSQVKTITSTTTDANGNQVTTTVTDLVGSLNMTVSGLLRLEAGSGGDGFNNGGNGGSVTGVVVRERPNDDVALASSIVTGTGGRGVAGAGGDGGGINQSSIDGVRVFFVTGAGGIGNVGGHGGDVLGNGTRIYDVQTTTLSILTGIGGDGSARGGFGGSISKLSPILTNTIGAVTTGADIGSLTYITGNGGSAATGPGGNGGNISDSSPQANAVIDLLVDLEAGNGGIGTTGGNGGSLTNFLATLSAIGKNPETVTALVGHGGNGLSGKGGDGGSITNVKIPSRGLTSFNRFLAGNGGSSAAGVGGEGGDITNLTSGSVQGSLVVSAGAGGHGLTRGGGGGAVKGVTLNLGGVSTSTKALIVAGAGGDASAFIPNPNDFGKDQALKAFGGTVGQGGDGGTIDGFLQTGNQGSHADFVGGDGGSSLNYGTLFDTRIFVGKGGSVKNIKMSGSVGNIAVDRAETPTDDENVPIKSYNNLLLGETMARYVEGLRLSLNDLTDFDGNVGIVVGAAGKNKPIQLDPVNQPNVYTRLPASGSINGSLIDVSVNNLMSAVAGSVDRIAAIQVVQSILIVNGVVGADKGSFITPGIDPAPPDPLTGELNKGFGTVGADTRDYLNPDIDTLTSTGGPVRDGALIDGAIIAKLYLDGAGNPITLPGRAFKV